jgi:branched-chain amino acid transport system ATP-binding protein
MEQMTALLEVKALRIAYGKVEAVHGISLNVLPGEIVACVGANGAGKTTTLKAVSGLLRPQSGRIAFNGREISGLRAHEIVKLGISHVPEGRRTFPDLTVLENLRMGGYARCRSSDFNDALERIFGYFRRLSERSKQLAGTLSGGEQQMLSIGRALISGPTLLLVDEPSFGLAPQVVDEIAEILLEINASENVSVLLVEQNTTMAFSISDRTYVFENGEIVFSAPSDLAAQDPHVQQAYLGID